MQSNTQKISQTTYRTLFWALLIAFTVFRLFLVNKFGLGVDESHYLLYARKLAWGYFDHPPMVAFLGAASTALVETAFTARLGAVLCWALACLLFLQESVCSSWQTSHASLSACTVSLSRISSRAAAR